MTVRMDCNEKGANFYITGDIYDEHAECLCGMINSYVGRGVKELAMTLYASYYISQEGQRCLLKLKDTLGNEGVCLSFSGQAGHLNCL
jgi:hypothetical protein